MTFPRVAVLHIAHSSRYVPPAARRAICLDDAALAGELLDCDRRRSLLGRRFVRQHSSRIAAGPVDGRGTGKPFNFHCQPVCNPSNSPANLREVQERMLEISFESCFLLEHADRGGSLTELAHQERNHFVRQILRNFVMPKRAPSCSRLSTTTSSAQGRLRLREWLRTEARFLV